MKVNFNDGMILLFYIVAELSYFYVYMTYSIRQLLS